VRGIYTRVDHADIDLAPTGLDRVCLWRANHAQTPLQFLERLFALRGLAQGVLIDGLQLAACDGFLERGVFLPAEVADDRSDQRVLTQSVGESCRRPSTTITPI